MTDPNTDLEALKAKLLGETARAPFNELQRFFAQGLLLHVADGADLIDVGVVMAQDDAARLEALMGAGTVMPLEDSVARRWLDDEAQVWTSVVKPWILVQEQR